MEPRQVVAEVFNSISENGRFARHPESGLVVSTKRFSHELWTLILNKNTEVSTLHAYLATPRGYDVHEVIPGSGEENRVAIALLNEAIGLLHAREPYVLAGNTELLDIPNDRSYIADRYNAAIAEQRHGKELRESDLVPLYAATLDDVLRSHTFVTEPQPDDRMRYLN